MLIATFTGGWEVGLLKQREVEKVRRRITHSLRASELLQNGSGANVASVTVQHGDERRSD